MEAFRNAVNGLAKRPFVILYACFVAFLYGVVDYYNPVTSILFRLNALGKSDFFQNAVSILQFLSDPQMVPKFLVLFACVAIIGGAFAGLFLSGGFYIIRNLLEGREKEKREFLTGLKKQFLRVFLISVRVIFVGLVFLVIILIAAIPAMVLTRTAAEGRADILAAAILVDLLTAGVLYFSVIFFSLYSLFWYPAALAGFKKPFVAGKQTADRSFWRSAGLVSIYIVIFIGFNLLFSLSRSVLLTFLGQWAFRTVFFTFFITSIFAAFRLARSKME